MDKLPIDTTQVFQYGWNSVQKDFWYFVGIAFVVMVLGGIGSSSPNETSSLDGLGFLLSILMTCGTTTIFLQYFGGKKLPFSSLFTQLKQYLPVLGATLLLGLITVVGVILLIVPGIYFALKYQFTIQLIIDKNLGVMAAMKESARITNGNKMAIFVFDLQCLGVVILGVLALGVGLLVALPTVELATIKVYRSLVPATKA
jgi:uncharacterized membrane protein